MVGTLGKRVSPDDFLRLYPPAIGALAQSAGTLIRQAVPEAHEEVRLGWRLIGYRTGPPPQGRYFAFVAAFDDRVHLGFEYGALLPGQTEWLEGTGSQVRFVRLRPGEPLPGAELRALIQEAAALAELPKEVLRLRLAERSSKG